MLGSRYRFNEDEKRAVLADVVPMKSGHKRLTGSTSEKVPQVREDSPMKSYVGMDVHSNPPAFHWASRPIQRLSASPVFDRHGQFTQPLHWDSLPPPLTSTRVMTASLPTWFPGEAQGDGAGSRPAPHGNARVSPPPSRLRPSDPAAANGYDARPRERPDRPPRRRA
jgi:hypothetical protein